MMPNGHLRYGLGLSLVLLLIGIKPLPVIFILASSILIDMDHMINYFVKFRSLNLVRMNQYFRRNPHLENLENPLPILIFHNLETLALLLAASSLFPLLVYVLIGFVFHLMLDWKVMPTERYPLIIKLSLIGVILENRRRKRGNPRW